MGRVKKQICLLSLVLLFSGCGKESENRDKLNVRNNQSAGDIDRFVQRVDDVTEQMLHAQYWINKQEKPKEIIMSSAQIDAWNKEYHKEKDASELSFYNYDQQEETDIIREERLKKAIESMFIMPDYEIYDESGRLTDEDFWKELLDNRNVEAIKPENKVKYGITIARSEMKMLPYGGLLTKESGSDFFGEIQVSGILMNEPVIVLHESADSQWYFVFSRFCTGWIEATNVALCDNYNQWKEAISLKDFLLVTGDKIVLEQDTEHKENSGLVLYMGTKLELVEWKNYEVSEKGRVPYENYIVRIPIRAKNGGLNYQYGFVPVSRDVRVGYLPLNKENIITQMFKANGNRYGWGGMYYARDCSQYIMEVYRCFGLDFARNSKAQAEMPLNSYDIEGLSDEEKSKLLRKVPVGSIVYFPGHVMMYLGESNGEHYVISSTATLVPKNSEGDASVKAHTCMVTPLSIKRPNKKNWISEITKIVYLGGDKK